MSLLRFFCLTVSLFKPYTNPVLPPSTEPEVPPPPEVNTNNTVYQVRVVINSRRQGGRLQYLVDCEGYGPEERSWVDETTSLIPRCSWSSISTAQTTPLPEDVWRCPWGSGVLSRMHQPQPCYHTPNHLNSSAVTCTHFPKHYLTPSLTWISSEY